MKLTILGSGTCVPLLERSSPANLLEVCNKLFLIDCGPGTLHQILRAKIDYSEIDAVFITHFHADHVGELRSIIQALSYNPKIRRKKILYLFGPQGFRDYYLKSIGNNFNKYKYRILLREIKHSVSFGDINIECIKTRHSEESIAYRFFYENKSVVITGDCVPDSNLVSFSKNTNLLLIDCGNLYNEKDFGHLTSLECAKIAVDAEVENMILTHIYPTSSKNKLLDQAKGLFENTIIAEDLLSIKL